MSKLLRLKELRELHKLTQSELGIAVGVTASTIGMYERGERKPSFEMVEALCDYFNVDTDYLFGRSNVTTKITPYSVKNVSPKRAFLMDKLSTATEKEIDKLAALWSVAEDEELHNL